MFLVLGQSPEVAKPGLPLRSMRSLGRILCRRGGPSWLAAAQARSSSAALGFLWRGFGGEEGSWGGVGEDIRIEFFWSWVWFIWKAEDWRREVLVVNGY